MSWDLSSEDKIIEQLESECRIKLLFSKKIKDQKKELTALRTRLGKAEEVIKYYADLKNYNDGNIHNEFELCEDIEYIDTYKSYGGKRARIYLREVEGK